MPAGFTIKGIEPYQLRQFPDSVKLMYWSWVTDLTLKAKTSDLEQGFDAFGEPLRPISPKTRKNRKSEMTPTGKGDPTAPPLIPGWKLSRTISLLAGRALVDRSEFWWRFDPFTHASWSKILTYQQEEGRDVFGLSPQATEWVQQRALGNWRAWLRAGAVIPAELEGKKVVPPMKATGTAGPVAGPAAMPGRPIGPTSVFGIGRESAAGLKPGKWSGGFTEKELKSYLTQKAPANVQGRPGEYNRLLGHIWGQPPRPEPFSPVQPIVPKPKPPPRKVALKPVEKPVQKPIQQPRPIVALTLEQFAKAALQAARSVPESVKYNEEKVWIIDAYQAFFQTHPEISYAEFKRLLVEAHVKGLLMLKRFDLPNLLDAAGRAKDAASETTHGIATFNQIRI